ncbi:MAG: T9SS type A sorting domain-containing protein [Bacteroidetes bacterium]|nr:T9SS type A sorting domain-containing protein [Bacteroidota bacterium]
MKKNTPRLIFTVLLLAMTVAGKAQLCQNSTDTVYGLNSIVAGGSGQIVAIDAFNAGTTLIGSPAASSSNANGLGYNKTNQKFYFFNQIGAGTTEFVSFDPVTGTKASLAIPSSPALPTSSTGKIRSGAVNAAGDAYYTVFPAATTAMGYPVTGPAFYYYNIPGNNWVLITQSFKDISGNTVSEIKNLNSGDMAFDGLGRLWIVSSNSSSYAMYRIDAPLPTSPVASITVDTVIASTPTPAGVSITGIAFNSGGDLFLSSGSGAGAGNNQLYEMVTPTSPLTNIGTLPNGAGDDLTSCIHPFAVLPVNYFQFVASFNNKAAKLLWKADETTDVLGYTVERSNDAVQWKKIAFANRSLSSQPQANTYLDYDYEAGNNYYRIAQVSTTGQVKYSAIQKIAVHDVSNIYIQTNLVNNTLQVYSKYLPSNYSAFIFDNTGRLVYSGKLQQTNQVIDINNLQKGLYIIKFSSAEQGINQGTYKFVKY